MHLSLHLYFILQIIGKILPNKIDNSGKLLIVSYDGFRNEYLQENIMGLMFELMEEGVHTKYMKNVFPTKTFPNHHTIATGLYPEKHGVVANKLFDTVLNKELGYSEELYHYDPNILPIWTLNEMFDGTSGCMMWPGSDISYAGINCTFIETYNKTITYKERVDTIISWFTNEETAANLVMMYIEDPDKLAHIYGPESDQVMKMVAELNILTKYLHNKIKTHNLESTLNVIHLSDHGMLSVSPTNFINLTDFITNGTCNFYGTSPVLQVVPETGKLTEIYENLTKAAEMNRHFKIYRIEDLPQKWHYKKNQRVGPIIAVAEIGYAFQDMWAAAKYYEKANKVTISPETKYGIHGYDNNIPEMQSFFVAVGPKFKKNFTAEPFDTVDLYGLFCRILITGSCPSQDGNFERISMLLKEEAEGPSQTKTIVIVTLSTIVIVLILIFILLRKRIARRTFLVKHT